MSDKLFVKRFDGKDSWVEEIRMPGKSKEGHEGAVEKGPDYAADWIREQAKVDEARVQSDAETATQYMLVEKVRSEVARHRACLRGEHEAMTIMQLSRGIGFVEVGICKHCRCVFVGR